VPASLDAMEAAITLDVLTPGVSARWRLVPMAPSPLSERRLWRPPEPRSIRANRSARV
jgi:hypothetical protein